MSNTNKKFSLNKFLVWAMKDLGKKRSKEIWERILKMRNDPWYTSPSWQDQCNGKIVVNDRIDECDIIEEWCIVD